MPVFLFTDIEGSTRLWEEDTAEMGTVIACHSVILREEVSGYGGGTTKHTGDHGGIEAALAVGRTCAAGGRSISMSQGQGCPSLPQAT